MEILIKNQMKKVQTEKNKIFKWKRFRDASENMLTFGTTNTKFLIHKDLINSLN